MSNLQHYKTLISDEEVIQALIKESNARDGIIDKVRVRPNINFLQRTVSNMVSSNKRINTQQKLIAEEQTKNSNYRRRKPIIRRKTPHQLIQEILSERIKFVKSSETYESPNVKNECEDRAPSTKDNTLNESGNSKITNLGFNKPSEKKSSHNNLMQSIPIIVSDDSTEDLIVLNEDKTYNISNITKQKHKSKRKKLTKKKNR